MPVRIKIERCDIKFHLEFIEKNSQHKGIASVNIQHSEIAYAWSEWRQFRSTYKSV